MIEHRDLLLRYMAHVWYETGDPIVAGPCPDCFTTEEWAELRRLGEHANTACSGRLHQDLAEDPVPAPAVRGTGKRG